MEPTGISLPCPRCGGTMEFRHLIESHRTGAPVYFFRCENCGQVHTVEHRTASAHSSDPLTALKAAAERKRA